MAESNASKLANNILADGKFDATDVVGNITSTGIDDNASGNAITIESSKRVQFTRARSNTLGDSALEILPSDTVAGIGFRMENTNNDLVIEKSSPSGSEAEILRIRIGGGIALGGTGDANTLDDYEEGTWTPTYVPDSGAFTSVTYASTAGEYTKIGNTVYFTFYIQTNAITVGSASGNVKIGGLPFAPGGGAVSEGGGTVINAAYFAGDKPSYGTVSGSSEINLFYSTGSTANDILLDVSDLGTGGTDNVFQMMGTYITTA